MSSREFVLVEDFSARGTPAVKLWAIPRGETGLSQSWRRRHGDLRDCRGLFGWRQRGDFGYWWNLNRQSRCWPLVARRIDRLRLGLRDWFRRKRAVSWFRDNGTTLRRD